MKLATIGYLHGYGGAEKSIIMLSNAMAKRGHDVTLISIAADNAQFPIDQRVKRVRIPDNSSQRRVASILHRYSGLRQALQTLLPDITINFWYQSAYLCACMPNRITGKVIYSERGDPTDIEYAGLLSLVRKLTLPRIDGFVFQTRGAKRCFPMYAQRRSIVIPNPVFIRAEDFVLPKQRRKAIVSVGRLNPQKNQRLLIEAFGLFVKEYPDYSLEIYGDGPLQAELEERILHLGLKDTVLLMGTTKNIAEKIHDAAMFVLSSDYEGMPNALLEAMALGLPCISTDWKPGGVSDFLHNCENGILVPRGNVDAMYFAMLRFIDVPRLAAHCAATAKEIITTNSIERIYSIWEQFLFSYVGKQSNQATQSIVGNCKRMDMSLQSRLKG